MDIYYVTLTNMDIYYVTLAVRTFKITCNAWAATTSNSLFNCRPLLC